MINHQILDELWKRRRRAVFAEVEHPIPFSDSVTVTVQFTVSTEDYLTLTDASKKAGDAVDVEGTMP